MLPRIRQGYQPLRFLLWVFSTQHSFVPEVHPPPRSWFYDNEDMLEETWHMEFPRRPDMPDSFYSSDNGLNMWDYHIFRGRLGPAEAIANSSLSTGRIDFQSKLF